MKYNIRGQNIQVTDAMRDYTEKKLNRLEKYFDAPLDAESSVTMSVYKGRHGVEVTIPMTGIILRAEEKSPDMYASLDTVVDKLERQIRKYKTKVNRKFRQPDSIKTRFREDDISSLQLQEPEEELEVVRMKSFRMKPMDIEEAILQMDMVGHSFYVFNNIETKEVNVVYRRNDGKYGLIEQA